MTGIIEINIKLICILSKIIGIIHRRTLFLFFFSFLFFFFSFHIQKKLHLENFLRACYIIFCHYVFMGFTLLQPEGA